jgi:apolipoprotein N-acyltransferase
MKLALPVLTGTLLVASFPRLNQGYLAWIAFIPLIVFVARAGHVKAALLGGFTAGFIQFFVLLTWMPGVLVHYGGLSAVQAWLAYTLLAVVLACYPAASCGLVKYLICHTGEAGILLFPFVWVLSDYALSYSPMGGFPWLLAGYSQLRDFLSGNLAWYGYLLAVSQERARPFCMGACRDRADSCRELSGVRHDFTGQVGTCVDALPGRDAAGKSLL